VLMGESYAGHFIPNLALHLMKDSSLGIPVHGFAIGNPWTDPGADNQGAVEFWFSRNIISRRSYDALNQVCDYKHMGPLGSVAYGRRRRAGQTSCDDLVNAAYGEMGLMTGSLDLWQIYEVPR
jgi:hypothetical protein